MIDELLKIARKCDRRKEWTDAQWIDTLTNCISKGQYILKVTGKEISAFCCWLFIKDLNKVNNQYVEDVDGKIAYVQCAYIKNNGNGLLKSMIRDGVNKYKTMTHIFFCSDKRNNKKFLIPINKWRNK